MSAGAVARLVGSPATLRTEPFDKEASKALDSFDLSLDPNRTDEFPESRPIPILSLNVALGEVHYIQIAAVGSNEVNNFILDDREEGETLEHSVWHVLEGLFGSDIHKSPQIQIGARTCELRACTNRSWAAMGTVLPAVTSPGFSHEPPDNDDDRVGEG